ncbi:hypothetical protein QD47_01350, partial [Paenibacillus terrae]
VGFHFIQPDGMYQNLSLDFVNKIRTHSLFSFQRSNLHYVLLLSYFVSPPRLSGDLNNVTHNLILRQAFFVKFIFMLVCNIFILL